ncbi:MAG: cell division protein FtsQ [Paludibacteraceae bacterium]|nr:cell division protein FtsQ [Paludibacteraceae bacterium]
MGKIIRNILILLYIIAMSGYIIFAFVKFHNSDNDALCNDVRVDIKDSTQLQFVRSENIIKLLKEQKKFPLEKRISEIDLFAIEEMLNKIPAIKRAECYRTEDHCIRIDIYQRKPIFRVMSGSYNFYIDEEKKEIPIPRKFAANVPIVTGEVNKDFIKGDLFDFITYVRKNQFWDAQIEQINICHQKNVELIPRVGNHTIKLGTLDDYETKLNKLKTFYKNLHNIGWNQYHIINLEYKNQVVCTK